MKKKIKKANIFTLTSHKKPKTKQQKKKENKKQKSLKPQKTNNRHNHTPKKTPHKKI